MNQLKVYEFNQVKSLVTELVRLYKTNDVKTLQAHKDFLLNEIKSVFDNKDIDAGEFLKDIDDIKLSRKRAEHLLEKLRAVVEDYEMPSNPQVSKLFKKVKKLKVPDFDEMDKKSVCFIAWNDLSSNRKYFIYKNRDKQFDRIYSELSPNKIKGFCKICNQESKVSLFLCKSKTSGDGTYKKKGDYICSDSEVCNQHLTDIEDLYAFVENVSEK